jgi:hypothetical protein
VEVAVVGLKQPQREAVVEERQIVVHAAASGQRDAPLVRLVLERGDVARAHIVAAVRIWTADPRTASEAVGKYGEVLHRGAHDQTAAATEQTIILAGGAGDALDLGTDILIEKIGSGTGGSRVDRGIRNSRGLHLAMRAKVIEPEKNVDSGRVRPHRGGGLGRSLRTQARDSKADCACSQSEPANTTKRAINHSTSSAK